MPSPTGPLPGVAAASVPSTAAPRVAPVPSPSAPALVPSSTAPIPSPSASSSSALVVPALSSMALASLPASSTALRRRLLASSFNLAFTNGSAPRGPLRPKEIPMPQLKYGMPVDSHAVGVDHPPGQRIHSVYRREAASNAQPRSRELVGVNGNRANGMRWDMESKTFKWCNSPVVDPDEAAKLMAMASSVPLPADFDWDNEDSEDGTSTPPATTPLATALPPSPMPTPMATALPPSPLPTPLVTARLTSPVAPAIPALPTRKRRTPAQPAASAPKTPRLQPPPPPPRPQLPRYAKDEAIARLAHIKREEAEENNKDKRALLVRLDVMTAKLTADTPNKLPAKVGGDGTRTPGHSTLMRGLRSLYGKAVTARAKAMSSVTQLRTAATHGDGNALGRAIRLAELIRTGDTSLRQAVNTITALALDANARVASGGYRFEKNDTDERKGGHVKAQLAKAKNHFKE